MNEKEYRRALAQVKGRLSDEAVFLSEKYESLLKRIAEQITDRHSQNVRIVNNPMQPAGWYDGGKVVINIANSITKSFPRQELKGKSLIGILGHECGHENYSSVEERSRYLHSLMQDRKFYPEPPIPDSDEEGKNMLSIHEEFQRKDSAAVQIMCEIAGNLENILEDIYVEHKMCQRFPGNIREGIQLNNMRAAEKMASVNKQLSDGRESSIVMTCMLMQYAVCGYVNCWNGCEERYLECLKKCVPVIEKAVFSETPDARIRATNKLLLFLWDFIFADAKTVEKETREKEDNTRRICMKKRVKKRMEQRNAALMRRVWMHQDSSLLRMTPAWIQMMNRKGSQVRDKNWKSTRKGADRQKLWYKPKVS